MSSWFLLLSHLWGNLSFFDFWIGSEGGFFDTLFFDSFLFFQSDCWILVLVSSCLAFSFSHIQNVTFFSLSTESFFSNLIFPSVQKKRNTKKKHLLFMHSFFLSVIVTCYDLHVFAKNAFFLRLTGLVVSRV